MGAVRKPTVVPDRSAVALCSLEFLDLEFPEREYVCHPILQTQGVAFMHAWRGLGKTQVGIGIALAVATGTAFLKFHAPKPRRVLYIDGEMPGPLLQMRIKEALRRIPGNATISPDYLRVLTPDMQEDGLMPNLSTREGQAQIEALLGETELLMIDSITTLFRTGADTNQESSWVDEQEWILRLRRFGVSSLLVHHSSKNGTQRGTSKKEDIVDTSISLRRPADYSEEQGCRFELRFEKARSIFGADAAPFEAQLVGDAWTTKDLDDVRLVQVLELKESGLSLGAIADMTGIPKTTVHRLLKKGGVNDGK